MRHMDNNDESFVKIRFGKYLFDKYSITDLLTEKYKEYEMKTVSMYQY